VIVAFYGIACAGGWAQSRKHRGRFLHNLLSGPLRNP